MVEEFSINNVVVDKMLFGRFFNLLKGAINYYNAHAFYLPKYMKILNMF